VPETDIVAEVIEVICEVHPDLDASSLSKDTEFETLSLSSLELTEVIMEMEDRHDVELDLNTVDAAQSLKTIGDIVKLLEDIIREKAKA